MVLEFLSAGKVLDLIFLWQTNKIDYVLKMVLELVQDPWLRFQKHFYFLTSMKNCLLAKKITATYRYVVVPPRPRGTYIVVFYVTKTAVIQCSLSRDVSGVDLRRMQTSLWEFFVSETSQDVSETFQRRLKDAFLAIKIFGNFFYNEFGCKKISNFFYNKLAVKFFRIFFILTYQLLFFLSSKMKSHPTRLRPHIWSPCFF